MSRKNMGYIRISNDKQDMGKQCYLLLEHAREQQLHTAEFGVDLANVRKAVNPGLERPISYNYCRYFVQHDPALTAAWQPHSGLNLFEGMLTPPYSKNGTPSSLNYYIGTRKNV